MDIPNGSMRFNQAETQYDFSAQGRPSGTQEAPLMLAEALQTAIGYYVVCDFLVGTQVIETKRGILNRIGVNFIVLYEPDVDRYIVCDFYSLKFITVYNTTKVPASPAGKFR